MKNENYIVHVVVKYWAKFNMQQVCENIRSVSLERYRNKINYQMINRIMSFDRFFYIVLLTYEFGRYCKMM